VTRRIIAAGGPMSNPPTPPPADGPAAAEGVLQWLLAVALVLSEVPAPLHALRLLLVCGHVTSEEAGLELLAYEFFEQAFTLYEDAIVNSRSKVGVWGRGGLGGSRARLGSCSVAKRGRALHSAAAAGFQSHPTKQQPRPTLTASHHHQHNPHRHPNETPQVTALQAIVGTLHRCYALSADNRDALSQSAVSYAAKLLKRADQCRAACATSHIWWQEDPAPAGRPPAAVAAAQPPVRDASKVMAGLKRALKAVGAAKQQLAASGLAARAAGGVDKGKGAGAVHLGLYVEIANHYLYYFEKGVGEMSPSVVSQVSGERRVRLCQGGGELVGVLRSQVLPAPRSPAEPTHQHNTPAAARVGHQ